MASSRPSSRPNSDSEVDELLQKIVGSEHVRDMNKWLNDTELRIAVAGKTGAGKSTLLNIFLGVDEFKEGDGFDPVTDNVKEVVCMKKGIRIRVWDCPGLQDGSGREKQYLLELENKTNNDIHLLLYCIDAREKRSDFHKVGSAVDTITEILGKDIWKRTAIVLTFANIFERSLQDKFERLEDWKKVFADKVNEWQDKFQLKLKDIQGVEKSIIDGIKVLPAGYDGREALSGNKNWLSDLWAAILNKVKEDVKPAVVKLNEDRFAMSEEATKDEDIDLEDEDIDLEVDLHRQPIFLTPNVKKALGTAALGTGGLAAGAGLGAALGAGIGGITAGVATLGLAAGVGAGAGAAVGGAVGVIASALAIMYHNRKKIDDYVIPDQKGT